MCFRPKVEAPATPAPLPPIEAPQFGNEELKKKNKGKGLKIGTKQLQIPLGGSEVSSGLAIPTKK